MSDSNGNGTLKRARSPSPSNNGPSSGGEDRTQATGKKQNTGRQSTSSSDLANASGSAGSPGASRRVASSGTMEENGEGSKQASSSAAQSTSQSQSAGEQQSGGEAPAPQITIKALIVTQDASIIIGKGGAHIKEIRERAGARVSVSDQIPGNPERILNVTGPLDAVSKAYGLIVRKINDEPYDQPSVPGSRAVTIKYIVPNSRMGSVIGKAGSKIKEIQEASGAKLQASEAMLAGSTERILSVSGVADAVHIAVYYVGTILQEGQDRQSHNIPYRPAATGYPPSGQYPSGGHPSRLPPNSPSTYYPGQQSSAQYAGYGGGSSQHLGPTPAGFPPSSAPRPNAPPPGGATQQIYIPNDMVGVIIGKGGAKINELRQLTSCQIKIMDPGSDQGQGASPGERLVQITGSPPNIAAAVQMMNERLMAEKFRKAQHAGGAPQPQHAAPY